MVLRDLTTTALACSRELLLKAWAKVRGLAPKKRWSERSRVENPKGSKFFSSRFF